jgi:hypothetical protein
MSEVSGLDSESWRNLFCIYFRIYFRRSTFLYTRYLFRREDVVGIVPSDVSVPVSNISAALARTLPLALQNSRQASFTPPVRNYAMLELYASLA